MACARRVGVGWGLLLAAWTLPGMAPAVPSVPPRLPEGARIDADPAQLDVVAGVNDAGRIHDVERHEGGRLVVHKKNVREPWRASEIFLRTGSRLGVQLDHNGGLLGRTGSAIHSVRVAPEGDPFPLIDLDLAVGERAEFPRARVYTWNYDEATGQYRPRDHGPFFASLRLVAAWGPGAYLNGRVLADQCLVYAYDALAQSPPPTARLVDGVVQVDVDPRSDRVEFNVVFLNLRVTDRPEIPPRSGRAEWILVKRDNATGAPVQQRTPAWVFPLPPGFESVPYPGPRTLSLSGFERPTAIRDIEYPAVVTTDRFRAVARIEGPWDHVELWLTETPERHATLQIGRSENRRPDSDRTFRLGEHYRLGGRYYLWAAAYRDGRLVAQTGRRRPVRIAADLEPEPPDAATGLRRAGAKHMN